jgi:hypothetical protein
MTAARPNHVKSNSRARQRLLAKRVRGGHCADHQLIMSVDGDVSLRRVAQLWQEHAHRFPIGRCCPANREPANANVKFDCHSD